MSSLVYWYMYSGFWLYFYFSQGQKFVSGAAYGDPAQLLFPIN